LSLFVAFIITPWAAVKLLKVHKQDEKINEVDQTSRLDRVYKKIMEKASGDKNLFDEVRIIYGYAFLFSLHPCLF